MRVSEKKKNVEKWKIENENEKPEAIGRTMTRKNNIKESKNFEVYSFQVCTCYDAVKSLIVEKRKELEEAKNRDELNRKIIKCREKKKKK